MKLFLIRFDYKNGEVSHPWTVFASSFKEAVSRLEHPSDTPEIDKITVKDVPELHAGFYGRDYNEPNDAAIEHTEIEWKATP
ncbi:hypothetical protein [Agrobacterium tumefaciens]|uniref:hypothetical protein n=1 Tax=Agrobacterium tumefaciens TaxID=358 RepID=UPI001575413B|nr:hypothetical protein [Agrobacterium tumefaciens]NTZ90449.1 hypothetical protein [Agrobacterium tumefaciens]